ncbi:DNA replication and repair protein RecF [Collinsella sp. AGMB00827]|uniref:DNA replication and repair protein RecF n=1 Tax=Collinsella ureilytica TaxID=2869515 RepID=A0ABS7ML72_9ACTN|nr:DNA replication and repair protein RecF [Collinsella urealyticum]MBY4797798.1 DNA replication and repair protein RecF [Collinsella urealyticum]
MSLIARTLALNLFRSYTAFDLALGRGTTILVGPNASGKTNLIEAIQLLTTGQSFRRPAPQDLIHVGDMRANIELRLEGEGRQIDMACEIEKARKRFTINTKAVRANGVHGILPSVLFCPDHLDMIKRSAHIRRDALDDFGSQLNGKYAELVSTYTKTLEQRNALLRDGLTDQSLRAAWDEALVSAGSQLMIHRARLLTRIAERMHEVHARFAPQERLSIQYAPSAPIVQHVHEYDELSGETDKDQVYEGLQDKEYLFNCLQLDSNTIELNQEEIKRGFLDALHTRQAEEDRRGLTLTGPHRDEILFQINDCDARSFASQGQQRTLVLAWKIAEVMVTKDILGHYPILLLDDVMSELDQTRRAAFMTLLDDGIQSVITTTNLGYFESDMVERAQVVKIHGTS